MAISLIIPQSARNEFQAGVEHVAQQMQSRFKACATVATGVTGKSQAHRKIQKAEMTDVTGRIQPVTGIELALEHRFLYPRKASLTTWIDEDDAQDISYQFGPEGETQKQHNAAAARKIDRIFLEGILGTNYEGLEDSPQPVTLPNSQVVAVNYRTDGSSANIGLTLAKLIKAKGRFGKLEVYGQENKAAGTKIWIAVSQSQLDDLLRDVEQIGSADYNKVKALVDGEVDYFMGINFMRTEQGLYTDPGGGKLIRSCPMWTSDGVHFDFWYDIKTSIDVMPHLSHAVQVRSRIKVNSCRKEENRVVNILCEEDA